MPLCCLSHSSRTSHTFSCPCGCCCGMSLAESVMDSAADANSPSSHPVVMEDLGRIKPRPTCEDETLKKQAMTTEELSLYCFSQEPPSSKEPTTVVVHPHPAAVSDIETTVMATSYGGDFAGTSSSASTASTASVSSFHDTEHHARSATANVTPMRMERRQSLINKKVTTRTESRVGRSTQRWFTDPVTNKICRLVAGCVPIVEGGKILVVSASRKAEWILPKGGWETDESIEEAAIRESFEEAGVLGILGPRLAQIEYETRKSKKRRREMEELQKKTAKQSRDMSPPPPPLGIEERSSSSERPSPAVTVSVSADMLTKLRDKDRPPQSDDTASMVSDATGTPNYSHVRMTLFPLYVSEVKKEWPESGRFRKVLDIDEAIKLFENRPEFKQALEEVRAKGLHLAESTTPSSSPISKMKEI